MPEYPSALGISEIERAVKRIVDEMNRSIAGFGSLEAPEIKGILFNRVRTLTGGTQYQESVMARVREQWPGKVFESFISHSDKIVHSAEPSKLPIAISGYAADEAYEDQLKRCAEEFMDRIEA